MKIAVLSITKNGAELSKKLFNSIECDVYVKEDFKFNGAKIINFPLKRFVKKIFKMYDALVFIMATGIVVRVVADCLKDKFEDPAVVVIDEKGKFVISLLSGHVGGANELAKKLSKLLNAVPVITTASDVNGIESIDMIAKRYGFEIERREDLSKVSAAIVNSEPVDFIVDPELDIEIESKSYIDSAAQVYITNKVVFSKKLHVILRPKNLVLGIGCKKNIQIKKLLQFVENSLVFLNLSKNSIRAIATIELKKKEDALLKLSKYLNVPLKIYSVEDIKRVENLFEGSEFVKKIIGVGSVARPVGYLESNMGKELFYSKKDGMVLSIYQDR
jgi:cobalt-precorrin 5A hydrolase